MNLSEEAIVEITKKFEMLGISSLLVGASARDYLAQHYNLPQSQRRTSDIDFAILVEGWSSLEMIKENFRDDPNIQQVSTSETQVKYKYKNILPFDVVPFGGIEKEGKVAWPPLYETIMTVLGYQEALATALEIIIGGKSIKVVCPELLIALKFLAWGDNHTRQKDLYDIGYLIENFSKIEPNAYEFVLDNCMSIFEQFDFETDYAELIFIGVKIKSYLKEESRKALLDLIENKQNIENIVLELKRDKVFFEEEENNFEEKIKLRLTAFVSSLRD